MIALLTLAVAQALTAADGDSNGTWWEPTVSELRVHADPDANSAETGRLVRGEPFGVIGEAVGAGCGRWGWLGEDAWTCLDFATPSDRAPVVLPRIVPYEPPRPVDYDAYQATGVIPEALEGDGLLPFVYARRWKTWKGRTWADLAAWERGDPPNGTVPVNRRARFVDVHDTARGKVFVREGGGIVPESDVYVFPVSRFAGRDLTQEPLPAGTRAAWAVHWDDTPMWEAPVSLDRRGKSAVPPVARIPYHTPLVVEEVPGSPRWWRVVDGLPGDPVAYVEDVLGVRVWHEAARPSEVGPDEVWIDVDRSRQTLGVLRGDVALYATLVSTGTQGHSTPLGTTQVFRKAAWTDMTSAQGSADPYHVEAVPWSIYFRPMYALHGAYWHWGFGHTASHGCVNLAPRDAAWIYDVVLPEAPPGWLEVRPGPEDAATWVRVR